MDVNGKLEKRWVYKRQDMVGANNGALVARRRAQFCKVVLSNTLTHTYSVSLTHTYLKTLPHILYTQCGSRPSHIIITIIGNTLQYMQIRIT